MSHTQTSNAGEQGSAVDFMALLGRCLGNFKIVERVITTFRETGESDLHELEMAIEEEDYSLVMEISHRLKGASSNVSATGLAKLLLRAEVSGRERNRGELMQVLADLKSEWELFMTFARAFVPSIPSVKLTSYGPHVQKLDIAEAHHACVDC